MNLWALFDRMGERRAAKPGFWERCLPIEFRGWLALGLFIQSSSLFGMLALFPHLSENQGFLTLASAVIVTGWIGGAAAFAYSAGKGQAERQEQLSSALRLAEGSQSGAPPTPPATPKAAAEQVADAAAASADRVPEGPTP